MSPPDDRLETTSPFVTEESSHTAVFVREETLGLIMSAGVQGVEGVKEVSFTVTAELSATTGPEKLPDLI